MRALLAAFWQTARLMGAHRRLWVPFLVTVLFEVILLTSIWLAPLPPFSKFFAPPIRYFFGERMLHYPWHLWFLYHAMKHTQFVATTLIGAFMTGITCVMVRQVAEGRSLSFREALVSGSVRYGTTLVLWLLTWASARGATEAIGALVPHRAAWVIVWSSVVVTVLLQVLLVYAIPAAVFEGLGWWRALRRGLQEAGRYPFSTFILVGLSSMVVVVLAILVSPTKVANWMLSTTPELIVIPALITRLVVLTVADAFLTVSIAHLWWVHRLPQTSVVYAQGTVRTTPADGSEVRHVIA